MLETLRSGWLSLGPTGPRFEELLAEARRRASLRRRLERHRRACTSAMRLAGVGPGDEVITSPFSFVASANCAIYEGATPVFADIDPRTYNLDPAAVEAAITERTKAIVAVDIFGYPCELDPLLELCDRHGLALVEDACEALGARYKGRRSARTAIRRRSRSIPNKQMTTGEGGAVTTNDEEQYELLVSLRNQGRLETSSWLQHGRLGYNYRLDDISAALGIGQLEKLDRILAARAEVAARYAELLAGVDVEPPLADDEDHVRSWFVYVVKLPAGVDRDARRARACASAASRRAPYVPSIHLQPYMRERYGFREGMLPGLGGLQRAHARAAVPRAARARRPGVRRRDASHRPAIAHNRPDGRRLADDLPRLRQVRARRQDLRARAARGDERGGGRRTRVWVEGVPEPIVASRTERTILARDGPGGRGERRDRRRRARARAQARSRGAEQGRLDLGDLQRRARRLLEATDAPGRRDKLF